MKQLQTRNFLRKFVYIMFDASVGFSSYILEVVELLDSSSEDEEQIRALTLMVSEPQSDNRK